MLEHCSARKPNKYVNPMRNGILTYFLVLFVLGVGIVGALEAGRHIYSRQEQSQTEQAASSTRLTTEGRHLEAPSGSLGRVLREQFDHPLSVVLIQIVVIIISATLAGKLFSRLGQPEVVGQMIAGILLGPSFLGLLSPEVTNFLFPPHSLDSLLLLSQIGVILFMFTVGTELDLSNLRGSARAAVFISHASIAIPFLLGAIFSLLLYPNLASPHTSYHSFALFISVAMSITAFPVLARILEERRLSKSLIGNMTLVCAAVDDVTAWCLLAVVVAIVNAGGLLAGAATIGLTILFIVLMLLVVRPIADRLIRRGMNLEAPHEQWVVGILAFVFVSAFFTQLIGVHAIFGAFVAGLTMPKHPRLRTLFTERLEVFTKSFLLPLYFTTTGLRTQIGLLNGWRDWLLCASVVAIAISGKFFGSMFAARWVGLSWHGSLILGVLMNTRGLIELIVLNIGYDLGILNPRAYSIMVLMALITTFMTGPLLSLLQFREQPQVVDVNRARSAA